MKFAAVALIGAVAAADAQVCKDFKLTTFTDDKCTKGKELTDGTKDTATKAVTDAWTAEAAKACAAVPASALTAYVTQKQLVAADKVYTATTCNSDGYSVGWYSDDACTTAVELYDTTDATKELAKTTKAADKDDKAKTVALLKAGKVKAATVGSSYVWGTCYKGTGFSM